MWVYVCGSCNFRSEYCIDNRYSIPHSKIDTPLLLDRLGELQEKLGYTMVLTGGEPMAASNLVHALFDRFPRVTKTIQTNGSLTNAILALTPKLCADGWISISYHDFMWCLEKRETGAEKTVDGLLKAGKNVFIQFMCTPEKTSRMAATAARFRDAWCKVALRRIFSYPPELFPGAKRLIVDSEAEDWALPSFVGRDQAPPTRRPFLAANIYLDGTIGFVCEEEVVVGNLYSG